MGLLERFRNLWRREELDAEIDEELRSHLEMAAEDAERAGIPPAQAQRNARVRFGNRLGFREQTTQADAALALDAIWHDVRFVNCGNRRSSPPPPS